MIYRVVIFYRSYEEFFVSEERYDSINVAVRATVAASCRNPQSVYAVVAEQLLTNDYSGIAGCVPGVRDRRVSTLLDVATEAWGQ